MAHSARIDDVVKGPGGSVHLLYTEGETPLPAGPGGDGVLFSSVSDFVGELEAAEARVASDLKFIQAAKGYKSDPALGATFMSLVKGKTTTLDLTGQVPPIVVG